MIFPSFTVYMDLKKKEKNNTIKDTEKLIKKENILYYDRRTHDEEIIYPPHYMLYLSIVSSQGREPRIFNLY